MRAIRPKNVAVSFAKTESKQMPLKGKGRDASLLNREKGFDVEELVELRHGSGCGASTVCKYVHTSRTD